MLFFAEVLEATFFPRQEQNCVDKENFEFPQEQWTDGYLLFSQRSSCPVSIASKLSKPFERHFLQVLARSFV